MEIPEIIEWIKTEFAPLTLATPDKTIQQIIENSIRYFNSHSGIRLVRMYNIGTTRVQLGADISRVIKVYPSSDKLSSLEGYPMWTLLGVTMINYLTEDLIMLNETLKNYRYYVGQDFKFIFERNSNPLVGGYLYFQGLPTDATSICVVATKRIVANEDITDEYTLDWMQRYVKANLKMVEGNTLRKSGLINATNDGQELINEGKEEIKELQADLFSNSKWAVFAGQRF